MFIRNQSFLMLLIMVFATTSGVGCSSTALPAPSEVVAPTPLSNNTGEYMAPYTKDGVLTQWVDKAVNAKASSDIGGAVGSVAGGYALQQVPFVGGILGNMAGKEIGRQAAIAGAGGMDHIKQTSDQSFASIDDLCVWLYALHSNKETYSAAIQAVGGVYPEYNDSFHSAVQNAAKR